MSLVSVLLTYVSFYSLDPGAAGQLSSGTNDLWRGNMKALLLSLALTALNAHAAGSQCTYTYSASAAKISWTAYKTTAKIAVVGQLSGATLTTPTTATNLV